MICMLPAPLRYAAASAEDSAVALPFHPNVRQLLVVCPSVGEFDFHETPPQVELAGGNVLKAPQLKIGILPLRFIEERGAYAEAVMAQIDPQVIDPIFSIADVARDRLGIFRHNHGAPFEDRVGIKSEILFQSVSLDAERFLQAFGLQMNNRCDIFGNSAPDREHLRDVRSV
jgi:hypothetical protein